MKHPALARVFSIVLALCCLFMLLNGVAGFGNADEELGQAGERLMKLETRAETYRELSEKLEGSISYDDALAQYEKLLEQHEDDAAQHRTDLATHTATMGGYEMGADMIWDGKAQLEAAKQELADAQALLDQQGAQLEQVSALLEKLEPLIPGILALLQQSDVEYESALALLDAMIARLEEQLGKEPSQPVLDQTQPTEPVEPAAPGEEATQEEKDQYEKLRAEYEALLEQYLQDNDNYQQALALYEQALAAFQEAYDQWQQETEGVAGEISSQLGQVDGLQQAAEAALNAAIAQLPEELQNAIGSLLSPQLPDLSSIDPEQLLQLLYQLRNQLVADQDVATAVKKVIDGVYSQVAAAQAALDAAQRQVIAGENTLKKAEHQLQHQLELLWWNMGQLEDEGEDLAEDKEKLDAEGLELDKMLATNDELKEMEQDLRSARVVLLQEEGIAQLVDGGGEIYESALSYIEGQRAQAQYEHKAMYLVNILAVIGGVLGILDILPAYDKPKSHRLLVLMTLVCLLLCLGADGLNLYLGRGQMYTALFAALMALVQLLIVIPKEKKPVLTAEPEAEAEAI